jgi:hypothetical protein
MIRGCCDILMMRSVIISEHRVPLSILIMVPVLKFYGDVVGYPDVFKEVESRSVNEIMIPLMNPSFNVTSNSSSSATAMISS